MKRPRLTTMAAVLAIMAILLAACGGAAESTAPDDGVATASPTADAAEATSSPSGEAGNTVSLAGGQFAPGRLTIAAGDTVTFTDTANHTVTEGSDGVAEDDPIVDETGGADIEVTFDEPGTYNITCKIHPSMNMVVTVEG
jgi:plastocyanin